jgi:hypothetical protein
MSMMLKHFQKLSEGVQFRELLVKGVCIGERRYRDSLVLLFHMSLFYAEVFFDHRTDEVITTRSFESTDELWPYLEQIDLTALFS